MTEDVILDTGVISLVLHPRGGADAALCSEWLEQLLGLGNEVLLPEICLYETRRKLLHLRSTGSLARLDELASMIGVIAINSEALKLGAELWAEARRRGRATGPERALDVDVILCAQARLFAERSRRSFVVATTNVRHLGWFVAARRWQQIEPS